jgi:hypothetical protein
MALQYPGYTNIQASPSSLAAFLPAFQAGQTRRADENAFAALANVYGGQGAPAQQQPQSALEMLAGFGSQPYAPATGPIPTAQPDVVAQSHASVAQDPTLTAVLSARGMETPAPSNGIPQGYLAAARAAESGGNDAAANPRSTALGRYQFLESTWNGLMQQYPELGLTANGRTDPGQQERAMARFTEDNARTLAGAGIPVNPGNLYAAHFLGAGGATNVLGQNPASPLSAYLEPGVIEANPHLQGMSVGDFVNWTQNKGGNSSGGYAPPTVDAGAVQGARAYAPDAATLETLFRSEATRPVALSIIGAQQEANASQGRFVTEEGPDGSIWQRDTLTGQREILREAPAAPEQQRPLEVGGVLLDPVTYQPIFDSRTTGTPDLPVDVREYEFYSQQETTAGRTPLSFADYQASQRGNGLTVTTNPDGTTTVMQGGSTRPLTEGQSRDTVYVTRANGALPIIDAMGDSLTSLPQAVGGNVPVVGNYLKSPEYQQAQQAGREFLASILRKDTGAAVTPSEEQLYGEIYLPRPGDSPEVLAQKQQSRARAVAAIEAGLPPQAILQSEQALASTAIPTPAPAGSVTEGTIIENDAGERMILRNGQWEPYNG